jgi:cytoskeletal protein RodZ
MFAAGLILIILAIIVVIYVIFATVGLEPMSIDWGVFTADLTPLQLFLLGAVTVLVLAMGSVMLSVGLKTQGEKRAEVKRLRKEVEKSKESRSAEAEPTTTPDSPQEAGSTKPAEADQPTDKDTTAKETTGSPVATRPFVTRRPSGETPPRPPTYRTPSEGSTPPEKTPPSASS